MSNNLRPEKRKSYTILYKLNVLKDLAEKKEDGKQKTKAEIIEKYGISYPMLNSWLSKENEFKAILNSHGKSIKSVRRVGNGGRQTPFVCLDNKLKDWVIDNNNKGLVIKDKYLKAKALNFSKELSINEFSCSGGYINNFKNRHGFVSRVHTSCRMLPDNAKELALEFINSTRKLIKDYNIKDKNIINFDQVPRYFEQEFNKTLTLKGSKNVKLLKANNTHSRFTFTPIISADGKFLGKHCLFSKLKKVPKDVNNGVSIDVNQTGMWSEDLVSSFMETHILSRPETFFAREPVLVIIDSFSAHLKIDKKYENMNVFISFVPKGMTPLLQMLDVSINRSFQNFYGDKINEWLRVSMETSDNRTKSGNMKKPSYKTVSDICFDFAKTCDPEMIKKSFLICGITGDAFDIEKLHLPLKNLLIGEDVNTEDLFFCEETDFFEIRQHQAIENFISVGDDGNSFFKIISKFLYDSYDRHLIIRELVIKALKGYDELKDLYDDQYIEEMSLNGNVVSELEIYATAKLFSLDINLYYAPDSDAPSHTYRFKLSEETDSELDILKYRSIFYIKKY